MDPEPVHILCRVSYMLGAEDIAGFLGATVLLTTKA